MKFTNSMFNEFKDSIKTKSESSFKDMLKFEAGKTYNLRLVPNLSAPKKSIFHYYHHSWTSLSTNKFVTAICPTTYGESCPICSQAIKVFRSGSAEEKEKNKLINRKENWLVNAYVVADPTNSDNVGKVKIFRYGREIDKVITSAIDGEDADEFGSTIFDVVNGNTLRVKCESRSGSTKKYLITYSASKFTPASVIDVDDIDNVHESIFKLDEIFKSTSAPELQRLLEKHYFCSIDSESEESDSDINDDVVVSKPKLSNKQQFTSGIESVFEGVETAKAPEDKSDSSLDDLDDELRSILEKY
jgi:hypothetical protein